MDHLHKQVRRARRRLILQSFIGRLTWCWFAALLVAVVAIGVGKIWPLADTNDLGVGLGRHGADWRNAGRDGLDLALGAAKRSTRRWKSIAASP